ncbi:hypothetical protein J2752_000501 [Halarchaeum rubridurum]|uniref:Uncharacterized protein n=1 Tax=Halarchaeum rubridurum TaxID=489911 RepID=A0A830FM62_9EURY|nr:hypothetical protein [Halarchaeum rubridurum]MBP1953620.1 hypothetical protein [Halarchaeum rubridurum]GGM63882.1 hypothetical protein GCM10009017_12440 [Halarchaeum rubridurum]
MSIDHQRGLIDDAEPDDPDDVIEEHRELFERLANTDLRVSKYAQNALNRTEDGGGRDA